MACFNLTSKNSCLSHDICSWFDDNSLASTPYCGCNSPVSQNIAFVMDSSGSLSSANWQQQLDFASKMIKISVSNKTYLCAISFSTKVSLDYKFDDIQLPRDHMIQTIQQIPYQGQYTYTKPAIQVAINQFENHTINTNNSSATNLLVLITDGDPTRVSGDPCDLKQTLTNQGIKVVIIGIGISWSPSKVECLVDDPQDQIIHIDNFDYLFLAKFMAQMHGHLCPEKPTPAPSKAPTQTPFQMTNLPTVVKCETCYKSCRSEIDSCINDSDCHGFIRYARFALDIDDTVDSNNDYWLLSHKYYQTAKDYLCSHYQLCDDSNTATTKLAQLFQCAQIHSCNVSVKAKFDQTNCC